VKHLGLRGGEKQKGKVGSDGERAK